MPPHRARNCEMFVSPFAVAIDSREQLGYGFDGMMSDARDGNLPLVVPTEVCTLAEGDYGIVGHFGKIAVERKSHSDLLGTLAAGRERFERELERLAGYRYAAVVVEAEWSTILAGHHHSNLNPKTVFRSVLAYQQRYPAIHWIFGPGRFFGMVATYRILERYWREHERQATQVNAAEAEA
jgi:DNA excision repair protein ERCC-4